MRQKLIIPIAIILIVFIQAFAQTHVYGLGKHTLFCLVSDMVAATSTEFCCGHLQVGSTGTFNAVEQNHGILAPVSGTLANLWMRTVDVQPATGNLICELMTNADPLAGAGTATGISITIPANGAAQITEDSVSKAPVNAGERMYMRCTNNAGANSARVKAFAWTLEQ